VKMTQNPSKTWILGNFWRKSMDYSPCFWWILGRFGWFCMKNIGWNIVFKYFPLWCYWELALFYEISGWLFYKILYYNTVQRVYGSRMWLILNYHIDVDKVFNHLLFQLKLCLFRFEVESSSYNLLLYRANIGKNQDLECTPYIRETITSYLERKSFYFSTE
jgi:hypothetical protein